MNSLVKDFKFEEYEETKSALYAPLLGHRIGKELISAKLDCLTKHPLVKGIYFKRLTVVSSKGDNREIAKLL